MISSISFQQVRRLPQISPYTRFSYNSPHHLSRFIEAQEPQYPQALAELRQGQKRSHWMWFIFPQLAGLGRSATAQYYGIKSLAEARDYLAHPVLGSRLQECCEAVLAIPDRSAHAIFGSPDDLKLRSCATLFAGVAPAGSVFARLLDRYFQGEPDTQTLWAGWRLTDQPGETHQ